LMASTAILVLFLLPLLSMRTVSEEIRSGTMELLLTAPITDGQIVFGKFLAAFALYGGMLALTGLHLGVLFWFSQPEVAPVLAAYLGLLLLGAGLLALGLFFSSLTRNQIVAGLLTFGALLVLWLVEFAGARGGELGRILAYLSVTGHMEGFARGVITTRDLVFYLSFAAFWLFLARESVRSRRWRG
ncbi:MAG: ABC transporter permease subunit, partial [Acidobacteria bacterium]|nr:ABC transporter permease subunit [Acidobacteriota bacterium]